MLGYIASSGFGQVLLVTHNEQSESFCSQPHSTVGENNDHRN